MQSGENRGNTNCGMSTLPFSEKKGSYHFPPTYGNAFSLYTPISTQFNSLHTF
ncbi:hypothetical protein KsCSTR_43150 [Candidatus Kuenenia stuttgartiensis]|uniref:Uncharacterized protein n=1 Tax=Kuenenia stuttgartiensis TaxID=174633 RepID=Q1PX73_KUEST|nr:hypothetical protein KsCSTR_43150 [Candidatus Kuenenia stuttgartiensis]CAJ71818.1 unknown protein [Candidatus Kuenenia stuttgartiensis]